MTKKERIIGCVVGLVLLISVGIFIASFREAEVLSENEVSKMFKDGESKNEESQKNEIQDSDKKQQTEVVQKKNIVVEIKGEVKNPNVYTLNEGSRIKELIDKAGGLTQEADIDNINRASLVNDGQCIVIGNINDTEEEKATMEVLQGGSASQESVAQTSKDGAVNINTGTVEQLQTLTGIGAGKANAIIEYRESVGGFKTVEDIKNVSGIGDKTFEKIRDRLTV